MFSAIYYEEELADHPRVQAMLSRIPELPRIPCQRYGEIFNRKAQNFRLQKQSPALILARKHGNLVLPAPAGYGFSAERSFYFSHMLNCLYDCRYCFLQGMFRSGHYVLFINYEDFGADIRRVVSEADGGQVFYSGYDCDSLALDPVSGFCDYVLEIFRELPGATLELRTKSTQIRSLLNTEPLANVIVAVSFSPAAASRKWEHKVPAIEKRLQALASLQQAGWPIALRFEPILPQIQSAAEYRDLFDLIFARLD
ncbi:MAG: DNA photolyase, partial [Gammaproteobacteria bacterium]